MILRFWVWQIGREVCWLRAGFANWNQATNWVESQGGQYHHMIIDMQRGRPL